MGRPRPLGSARRSDARLPQQSPRPPSTPSSDGWFRTGDIGRIDADGFIFVEDRLSDMIISGGREHLPVEVERALSDHPAVLDAAVFGIPDEKWGESVKAVVELSASASTSEDELIEWCRGRWRATGPEERPTSSRRCPATPPAKLLKRDLRKAHTGREPRPRHLMVEIGDLLDRLHVVAPPMRVRVPGHHRAKSRLSTGPPGGVSSGVPRIRAARGCFTGWPRDRTGLPGKTFGASNADPG